MVISVLAAETLRQIAERRIRDLPDRPQRMVAPHPSLKLHKAEQGTRPLIARQRLFNSLPTMAELFALILKNFDANPRHDRTNCTAPLKQFLKGCMVNWHQRSQLAMNTQRLIVLGIALVAAGGAAFLVRGVLGGGTPAAQAACAGYRDERSAVANTNLCPPGSAWNRCAGRNGRPPGGSVFITHEAVAAKSRRSRAVWCARRSCRASRSPALPSCMAMPGLHGRDLDRRHARSSIAISADSSAGGHSPNDRVDVILTRKPQAIPRGYAKTILSICACWRWTDIPPGQGHPHRGGQDRHRRSDAGTGRDDLPRALRGSCRYRCVPERRQYRNADDVARKHAPPPLTVRFP